MKEYDQLVNKLDQLLDIVKEDERHELMGLIDIMRDLIEEYESKKNKNQNGLVQRLSFTIDLCRTQRGHRSIFVSSGNSSHGTI